jgi:hypothetical protein
MAGQMPAFGVEQRAGVSTLGSWRKMFAVPRAPRSMVRSSPQF